MSNLLHRSTRRTCAVALVASVIAFGCGGPQTSVTQTWKASGADAPASMRSVLVFAARMDETNRRAFEDAFVARLGEHGVAARPSYALFPGPPPDREAARAVAERERIEGILVATNKGTEQVATYVPGSYNGDFWGGYYGGPMGMGTYSPGYVMTTEVSSLEMTLWDARTPGGRLVWSAATRTTEASQEGKLPKSVAEEVVPELADARLIPSARR